MTKLKTIAWKSFESKRHLGFTTNLKDAQKFCRNKGFKGSGYTFYPKDGSNDKWIDIDAVLNVNSEEKCK